MERKHGKKAANRDLVELAERDMLHLIYPVRIIPLTVCLPVTCELLAFIGGPALELDPVARSGNPVSDVSPSNILLY